MDVEDVDAHIKTEEHSENLEKMKSMFHSKVYQDDRSAV